MKTKNIAAIMLASLMALGTFAACGDSSSSAPADTTSASGGDILDTEAETEPSIYDSLPKNDYGGYEFRILNNISNFAYTNIGEEGLTGETLDDAIYNRNAAIADALNITFNIEKKEFADTSAAIPKVVLAGEDVYDFYTCDLNLTLNHVLSGYDINVLDINSLDLDNIWWNRTAIDSITVGDGVYAFYGDLHTGYFESYTIVLFNKEMLNNLNLSDPYAYVHDNKWTLDNMYEMMQAAKMDVDGDGKWTVADQYPLSMYEGNLSICFLTAADEMIITKNSDNIPVWNGLGERFITVFDKLATTVFSDKSNNAIHAKGSIPEINLELYRAMMLQNKVLFLITQVGVLKDMRSADFEIGVVPMPKYEESQQNYRSYIFAGANAVAVPITNSDKERTGTVLEYMAAYSHDTVRDVYFNQTLDFKYIQDEEGQEMLDIVLDNGVFDISAVYGWGDIAGQVMTKLNSGKTDIVSTAEKRASKIEAGIEKTLESFEAIKG